MLKCAYAQSGIFIGPQGTVMPCCDYKKSIPDRDHSQSLIEIHQSQPLVKLREQLAQGEKPLECQRCWDREDNGLESRRTLAQGRLKNIYNEIDWGRGNLLFFGGFLGNLCNLGCRVCRPELSSVLASEQSLHFYNKQSNWAREEHFWNNFKNVTSIKNYEILGGEPLYNKNFLSFLDHLVDSGRSSECVIDIVTNGTIYPKIIEKVDQFQEVTFNISIDNLKDKFELERYGASWNLVNNNISKMIKQKEKYSNLFVRSTTAVSIQNVLDLPELYQYFKDQNFDSYWFGLVDNPTYWDIKNMTVKAQELVLTKLEKYKDIEQISGIIEVIKNSKGADGKEFVTQTKLLDQKRKQDFRTTHPDIAKAMGYV